MVVITEAKKILPKNAIIGISAASVEEAQTAIDAGADYLGIGTMFATPTYVFLINMMIGSQNLTTAEKPTQNTSSAPLALKPSSMPSPTPAAPLAPFPLAESTFPMFNASCISPRLPERGLTVLLSSALSWQRMTRRPLLKISQSASML